VIGRNKRDYVWIMARKPQMPEADYQRLLVELAAQGYDLTKLRKVPPALAGQTIDEAHHPARSTPDGAQAEEDGDDVPASLALRGSLNQIEGTNHLLSEPESQNTTFFIPLNQINSCANKKHLT